MHHQYPAEFRQRVLALVDAGARLADVAVVVGDFSNFGIADGAAVMVHSVPVVVGSNQRPTGEGGVAVFKWTGSDVLNAAAFRLLQVAA